MSVAPLGGSRNAPISALPRSEVFNPHLGIGVLGGALADIDHHCGRHQAHPIQLVQRRLSLHEMDGRIDMGDVVFV